MSESLSDYRLFKFRPINNRLIDSLVMSRLWCAKPDTLNDPFDCQINLRNSWERAISLATGAKKEALQHVLDVPDYFETIREKAEGAGICSFSALKLNKRSASLQWSHYANEHKGVRLLYRFPKSFFTAKNINFFLSVVHYKDNYLTNYLVNTLNAGPEFNIGLTEPMLSSKSPAWGYEQEVRIIRNKPGYIPIPLGYLEQICFGLRTPQADIELVEKLAREHSGCKKFYQMKHDGKSDFGIRAVNMYPHGHNALQR